MKHLKLLAVSLLIGVVLPLIYFWLTPLSVAGVVVEEAPSCENGNDPTTYATSRWDEDTFVADISEPQTCGILFQSARVQRIGSTLFIRTSYAYPDGPVAACICRQNFSVHIPKLPRADYSIKVYNFP